MPEQRLESDPMMDGETKPINPLWVCEACEMIGEAGEARAHGEKQGHVVECLTLRESDAIRDIWAEQRAKRVAGFLTYAHLRAHGRLDAT